MADEQIDSLSIAISVKDNDSAKKIKGITDAIDSLVSSLKGLESVQGALKTLEMSLGGINKASKSISKKTSITKNVAQPQMAEYTESVNAGTLASISANTRDFNKQFESNVRIITEDEYAIQRLQIAIKTLEQNFKGVGKAAEDSAKVFQEAFDKALSLITEDENAVERLKIAVGKLDGTFNLSGESAKEAAQAFGYTAEQLDEMESGSSGVKKKFDAFFGSVKRIALYRAIRTALKEITQAMQYGIQNYARYDDATNKAMSNVMNSVNQLKNTLGVTLGQIMQTLAPLIETLTNAIVGLLDNINMALASLGNKSTYSRAIKQNEDYAKSIDKVNGKLLSFDTFNTLATDNGQPKGLFEEVEIPAELEGFPALLKEIIGLLKEFFEENKAIFELVLDIIKLLQPLLRTAITIISTIVQQVRGAFQIIDGFIKLLIGDFNGAWESIGDGFKNMLKGSLNMFISVVNLIIDAINFLVTKLSPIGWIFGAAGIDISIPHIPLASFANGGSFNTADMFFANENGQTELIASTNNGGAVMNMEQLQGAIYNGMIMAMADSGGKEIVLKVDQNTLGRVVANSTGFISETNRIKLIKV